MVGFCLTASDGPKVSCFALRDASTVWVVFVYPPYSGAIVGCGAQRSVLFRVLVTRNYLAAVL